MKEVKINFCDYYTGFDAEGWLKRFFPDGYTPVIDDEPDFLFCGPFGVNFLGYDENCVKIYLYGENVVPDFNYYDYAIGFHQISFEDRHLYVPNYAEFLEMPDLNRSNIDVSLCRRKFCNFIYSNFKSGDGALLRQEFCRRLMEYKRVDCPGRVMNNMKGSINDRGASDWPAGKVEFLKDYKFTIAFENSKQTGYTTEKLYQPFLARSVPIYWGNPAVGRDFNTKAFVNCGDYADIDAVMERVVELDNDDEQYMAMLRESPLNRA